MSYSAVNLQNTVDYIEAPCRRISSLMSELGHDRLDLIKIDIEGAEYEVLRSMLEDSVTVNVLCIEFDQPSPFRRTVRAVRQLRGAGYRLVHVDGWNCTFVREGSDAAGAPETSLSSAGART